MINNYNINKILINNNINNRMSLINLVIKMSKYNTIRNTIKIKFKMVNIKMMQIKIMVNKEKLNQKILNKILT